jgi:hypothetical protein
MVTDKGQALRLEREGEGSPLIITAYGSGRVPHVRLSVGRKHCRPASLSQAAPLKLSLDYKPLTL